MEDRVIVVIVKPNEEPVAEVIPNTLEALQKIVGGYIEMIPIRGKFYLVCNEEGKILGLPPNRNIGFDVVAGTFLLVKEEPGTGDIRSLTPDEVVMAVDMFRL